MYIDFAAVSLDRAHRVTQRASHLACTVLTLFCKARTSDQVFVLVNLKCHLAGLKKKQKKKHSRYQMCESEVAHSCKPQAFTWLPLCSLLVWPVRRSHFKPAVTETVHSCSSFHAAIKKEILFTLYGSSVLLHFATTTRTESRNQSVARQIFRTNVKMSKAFLGS